MPKSADAFRTISEVADWLGVQSHVLRFWESKFPQVKPVKRAGGRRYYRPTDMLLLGGIRRLLHDDGLTIKGVQKILREEGVAYLSDLSPPLDDDTTARLDNDLITQPPGPSETASISPPAPSQSDENADEPLFGGMQSGDAALDGIDSALINAEQKQTPSEDADAHAPVAPPNIPAFMHDPALDAAMLENETRDAQVPELTSDYVPDDIVAATPDPVLDAPDEARFDAQAAPFDAADAHDESEPAAAPDTVVEPTPDLWEQSEPAPVETEQAAPEQVATEQIEPAPESSAESAPDDMPAPLFQHFSNRSPASEPAPAQDLEPESVEEAPEHEAPEHEAQALQHKAFAPPTDPTDPELDSAPDSAPEPVEATPPRPRIVDVPDDVPLDEADIKPTLLSKTARASRLTPQQAQAVRPLLAQLTALRDQMANARRDHD